MFNQFRKEITRKQKRLYEALNERELQDQETYEFTEIDVATNIKGTINEFIDCDIKKEEFSRFEDDYQNVSDNIEYLDDCIEYIAPSTNQSIQYTIDDPDKDEFVCDLCSFEAKSKKEIMLHIKNCHISMRRLNPLNSFTCEMCDASFEKRHLLNRHVRLKHTEKERKYQCKICKKSFFNNSTLKKHAESHSEKNKPCEHCGKLFSCMNNLRTHLYYHSEPKFACQIVGCEKKFFMRKLLRSHMNVSI